MIQLRIPSFSKIGILPPFGKGRSGGILYPILFIILRPLITWSGGQRESSGKKKCGQGEFRLASRTLAAVLVAFLIYHIGFVKIKKVFCMFIWSACMDHLTKKQ